MLTFSISVYELLDELGGYLSPNSAAPSDITPLISALLKVNGAPLFDLYVDVDLYDRTKSSVYLDFPIKHQTSEFLAENQVINYSRRLFTLSCPSYTPSRTLR